MCEVRAKRRPRNYGYDRRVKGLTDYHVHTFRCGHAHGDSRDLVGRAVEVGLSEIAFTDHVPLYFLPSDRRDPRLAMAEDRFDGYVAEVASLQAEFRGAITVRLGLEADYAEGHERELERWLGRADWDLVLGSVHWVSGDWIDDPRSAAARFESEGIEPLYREYYRLLTRAARTGLFDVISHLDLPKKHGHRPAVPFEDAEEEAIRAIAAAGCAVEISSAGLRKPVGEPYPESRLLKRVVSAGIPVTFSSDAHAPAEVAWGYDRTVPYARLSGVTRFTAFEKRRKTFRPLPESPPP